MVKPISMKKEEGFNYVSLNSTSSQAALTPGSSDNLYPRDTHLWPFHIFVGFHLQFGLQLTSQHRNTNWSGPELGFILFVLWALRAGISILHLIQCWHVQLKTKCKWALATDKVLQVVQSSITLHQLHFFVSLENKTDIGQQMLRRVNFLFTVEQKRQNCTKAQFLRHKNAQQDL